MFLIKPFFLLKNAFHILALTLKYNLPLTCRGLFLLFSVISVCSLHAVPVGTNNVRKVVPQLYWLYGWKNGKIANTLGGPGKSNNVKPLGSATWERGYSPKEVLQAYNFDKIPKGINGTGTVIAIVDAYHSTTLQKDFDVFCKQFNLPYQKISIVQPQGQGDYDYGWAVETMLDIEWAHAIAPQAKIVLYEAKTAAVDDMNAALAKAVADKPTAISMSWGGPEYYGEPNYLSLLATKNSVLFAATGDSGAGVMWPSVSPYVVAVGGTSLNVNSNTGVVTETGWQGSGGGVSINELLPRYQTGWNVNTGRGLPDVSMVADPYTGLAVYVSDATQPTNNASWHLVGGTSASTPMWAGVAALLASGDSPIVTNTSVFLQSLYGNSCTQYSSLFNDIQQGSNAIPGWWGFNACLGYDLVTGLGTPIPNGLLKIGVSTASGGAHLSCGQQPIGSTAGEWGNQPNFWGWNQQ